MLGINSYGGKGVGGSTSPSEFDAELIRIRNNVDLVSDLLTSFQGRLHPGLHASLPAPTADVAKDVSPNTPRSLELREVSIRLMMITEIIKDCTDCLEVQITRLY
jgi:hypothetical protein